MSQRRFTDKPDLDPGAVWGLPEDHAAMAENRTLFPSTVIEVTEDEPARLLVSGANNRKLGATVMKGQFKGYALYGLSLEERATCPTECELRSVCYGNGMQLARRHRIGDPDVFFDRLGFEIVELLDEHPGLLIRLHVLGDFPSAEYVEFWREVLEENPNVACYGYTHRRTTAWDGDEIGDAIEALKDAYPDRFRIRWSGATPRPDGTVVIDTVPERPRVDEGLVCPAQTDATAACSTCALCWDPGARRETIVFIKHGRHSDAVAAETAAAKSAPGDSRSVTAIDLPKRMVPAPVTSGVPEIRTVAPTSLLVERSYQRDLSARSMKLIRKIVTGWDWAKFKPPICAETEDGLFVIDGQHTAIAAATHPDVEMIPVMVVSAPSMTERAQSFVAQNRDRLSMTPAQVFHGEVAAGVPEAVEVARIAQECGATIPRTPPLRGREQVGQIVPVAEIMTIYRHHGEPVLRRVLKIAVSARHAPIKRTVTRALRLVMTEPHFSDVARRADRAFSEALVAIGDLDKAASAYGGSSGMSRDQAAAMLLYEKISGGTA